MPPSPVLLALLLLAPSRAPAQAAPPAAEEPRRDSVLASDFDRGLLLDAGYFIESGTVLDQARRPLDEPALKAVLEELRARRKESVLAGLERVQEAFGRDGRLAPGERESARALLARGWPLISEDVRAGFNELLAQAGAETVRGPRLEWVERAAGSWEKAGPGEGSGAPSPVAAPPVPKSKTSFWTGRYRDEFSPPPADVVKARVAAVDGTSWLDPKTRLLRPYPDGVKDVLRVILRYADARDGAAVLSVLTELHPIIAIGNDTVPPFASGVTRTPDGDTPGDVPRIGLMATEVGYRFDPATGRFDVLPSGDPEYYKKLGLAPPRVAALDPAAKPDKVDAGANRVDEAFNDGSLRRRFTAAGLAPALMHELIHVDTYRIGAGGQPFGNEMNSMNAERRMTYNRDEARGLADSESYCANWEWCSRALDFRRRILADYSSSKIGEIRPGEETVEGKIAAERRLLAGGDVAAWETGKIDRLVDRERDNDTRSVDELEKAGLIGGDQAERARERLAAEAERRRLEKRAEPANAALRLKEQLARLQADREQTLRVFLEDWRWHAERGLGAYGPPSAKKEE